LKSRGAAVAADTTAPADSVQPLLEYLNQVRWWWNQSFGWGVAASAALHVVLVVVLSLIVLRGNLRPEWGVLSRFNTESGDADLELPLDSHLDLDLASAPPLEFTSVAPTDGLEQVLLGASDRILGAIDGQKEGDGQGDGSIGMNVRPPSTAVTKGSFTVWTDPEDPNPGQNYDIVIQVKLPSSVKTYRLRDLEGNVRGTDRYFKAIQYPSTERRTVQDGVVQVRVQIPGAAVLVRDTIKIRSQLLKEEQTIEIVF
jgi:hypothetical protein